MTKKRIMAMVLAVALTVMQGNFVSADAATRQIKAEYAVVTDLHIVKVEEPDASDIDETIISAEAYDACIRYGEEYGISPELLMAIIERESRGDPGVSSEGCYGLMQVAKKWHCQRMKRLGVTDLYDTDQNIHVGTDYLADLYKEHGDIYLVLMTYNMGYDTAARLYKQGKYSDYAQSIIDRAQELELLHEYI